MVAIGPRRTGGQAGEFVRLPFLIPGAWDDDRVFVLETLADLPEGSQMMLHVPDWLGKRLRPAPDAGHVGETTVEPDPDDGRLLRIPVDPYRRQVLGQAELPSGATADCHLLVHVPVGRRGRSYDVAVRQTFERKEVGRVTWRVHV